MITDSPMASAEYVAVLPDGTRRPLRVGVGVPRPGAGGEWRCPVWMDGLHERPPLIAGEDALQALGLAWMLLGRMLGAFVASGGRIEFPSGGNVPLGAYFGRESTPPGAAP